MRTFRATSVLSVLFAFSVFAQTRDTAAIFGGVTDAQGAAIPGAEVTLTSTTTGQVRKTTANEAGPIPLLAATDWRLFPGG